MTLIPMEVLTARQPEASPNIVFGTSGPLVSKPKMMTYDVISHKQQRVGTQIPLTKLLG